MQFHFHANKGHSHMKGSALRLRSFETDAQGNSEMAYFLGLSLVLIVWALANLTQTVLLKLC